MQFFFEISKICTFLQIFFIHFYYILKDDFNKQNTTLFLLAVRATAHPICAKNIVMHNFAKKILCTFEVYTKTEESKKSFIKKY